MLLRTLRFKLKGSETTHTLNLQGMKPSHMFQAKNHAVFLTNNLKQCTVLKELTFHLFEPLQPKAHESMFEFCECKLSDNSGSTWIILKTSTQHEVRRTINNITRKSSLKALRISIESQKKQVSIDFDTIFQPIRIYENAEQARKSKDSLNSGAFFHLLALNSQIDYSNLQKSGLPWMEKSSKQISSVKKQYTL